MCAFYSVRPEKLPFLPQYLHGQILHPTLGHTLKFEVQTNLTVFWEGGFYWQLEQEAVVCTCTTGPLSWSTKLPFGHKVLFKPNNASDWIKVKDFTVRFSVQPWAGEVNTSPSELYARTAIHNMNQEFHVEITKVASGSKKHIGPCVFVAELLANGGSVTIATRRSADMYYKL